MEAKFSGCCTKTVFLATREAYINKAQAFKIYILGYIMLLFCRGMHANERQVEELRFSGDYEEVLIDQFVDACYQRSLSYHNAKTKFVLSDLLDFT